MKGHSKGFSPFVQRSVSSAQFRITLGAVLLVGVIAGYIVGYVLMDTANTMFTSKELIHFGHAQPEEKPLYDPVTKKWRGDTVFSVLTSSGDNYQNYQTRIFYSSYKLVQQMPGGERMTGFLRILHRTVPDVLMDEVPTLLVKPLKPQCDGWCDYPVANRPPAIRDFVLAAERDPDMIKGAWVLMLECDYVWAKPMQVPGDAWDATVPGVQFLYDYILPDHPDAAKHIKKLYPKVKPGQVPQSGPSPVMMRFDDWRVIVPTYVEMAAKIEADPEIKQGLGWVREMYAWDIAISENADKTHAILTQHPPESLLIVQPPFDISLGNASMFHYTWGPYYYDTTNNKTLIYKWEKREMSSIEVVLKPPLIPMPPPFKEGILLEFDAPLTLERHNMVVEFINTMNKAISALPELPRTARTPAARRML